MSSAERTALEQLEHTLQTGERDGALAALAWLGALFNAPLKPLGVVNFGETGSLQQLYHKHHIDTDAVLTAMVQVLFGK